MRLAETMAVMGDRVILVEADLRKPTQLKDITEREGHGLTAVLADGRLASEISHITLTGQGGELRTLDILPAGPTPPNPTELLESRRMRQVLDNLAERYDMVIVDTPALTVVTDALALVAEDSTIVVVAAIGQARVSRWTSSPGRSSSCGATRSGSSPTWPRAGRARTTTTTTARARWPPRRAARACWASAAGAVSP